jgi:predicted RNase H-like nuclease
MRMSEVTICWTPNRPEFSSAMRGKYAVFPASACEAELSVFAHRAGRHDIRAQDPRLEVQALYATYIFYQMTELDGVVVSAENLYRQIFEMEGPS